MKKVIAAMMIVMGMASAVLAVDTITLTVTPNGTREVAITEASYDFGSLTLGTTGNVATSVATVTSTGTLPCTYGLRISTLDPVWTAGANRAAVAQNVYNLMAIFNSVAPLDAAFVNTGADTITGTQVLASAANYSGDETGVNVVPGAVRHLWFNLDMPASTTVTTQRSFVVELEARP